MFRNRNKINKKDKEKENETLYKATDILKNGLAEAKLKVNHQLPAILGPDHYKGPIIADFIEDLHNSFYENTENGINFVQTASPPPIKKKHQANKKERVLKGSYVRRSKVNKSLSLPRRRKSNESNDERAEKGAVAKFAETEVNSCNEWRNHLCTVTNNNNGVEKSVKSHLCCDRETSSILEGRTIRLGDFNRDPRCLSCFSLVNVPAQDGITNFRSARSCKKLLSVGNCKRALKE